jgi:hypothetical protein
MSELGVKEARNRRKSGLFAASIAARGSITKKRRLDATGCHVEPSACRGDWIRTSDLLNPIQAV